MIEKKGKGLPGTTPRKPRSGSAASKTLSTCIVTDLTGIVTSRWAHCAGCGDRFDVLRPWHAVCMGCLNASAPLVPAVMSIAGVA